MTRGFTLAVTIFLGAAVHAADWPQWQGPDWTRSSKETGLLKEWPAAGPRRRLDVHRTWHRLRLDGGRRGLRHLQAAVGSNSGVVALNRADGKLVWAKGVGPALGNDQGHGPRSTPTVDGDRIYVLTENGDLACLGARRQHRCGSETSSGISAPGRPRWLISESPLVDGPHVIVSPGGPDASMVKLDKMTGATVWTSKGLSDPAGYSSAIAADVERCAHLHDLHGIGRRRRARF